MIDPTKQYTYNSKPVRIYSDGSDTAKNVIPCAILLEDGLWYSHAIYESDLVEAWEPTAGETCYFWDDEAILPVLLEFDKFSPYSWGDEYGRFNSIQFLYRFAEEAGEYYEKTNWKYCAPFKGELPEAFKGLI